MKVLFISRASLYKVPGGDTIQMEQTAAQLRRLGIEVDIRLADDLHIDYAHYDLLHTFNITRPSDILFHMRKSQLPLVLSPIYLEYGTASNEAYTPLLKWLMNRLGNHRGEYLKNVGRAILKNEQIRSWKYYFRGQYKSIAYILDHCAMLLPNSESEFKRLKRDFTGAGDYSVVPNAVDLDLFHVDEADQNRGNKKVLCAARFEPRKNQLNVIRALNHTDFEVTFVGAPAPHHHPYYQQCKAEAAENIRFIDFTTQDQLAALYREHKVHILASWFETTGLSSLEAAACGCNIVITDCGDTKDYFGTEAWYCIPDHLQSIANAVAGAASAPYHKTLLHRIQQQYSWQHTAKETLIAYQRVLNK
ncbi:D-inositol-3-phosphate glycosyltransferase [compost metagenome]